MPVGRSIAWCPTPRSAPTRSTAREKVKQVVVRFYPNDEDEAIYAHLKAQPRMGEYVKRLVVEDMERAEQ